MKFENAYDVIQHCFNILENLDSEYSFVSIVGDIDLTMDLLNVVFGSLNLDGNYIHIDRVDYSKEYIVTINKDYEVSVEMAYNHRNSTYVENNADVQLISTHVHHEYISVQDEEVSEIILLEV